MATNKNDLNSYENLVFGLGETGMSIARYFNRKKINAIYIDTRRKNSPLLKHRDSVSIDTGKLNIKNMVTKMTKHVESVLLKKYGN